MYLGFVAIFGTLALTFFISYICYRARKSDEGSYEIEPKPLDPRASFSLKDPLIQRHLQRLCQEQLDRENNINVEKDNIKKQRESSVYIPTQYWSRVTETTCKTLPSEVQV